MINKEEKKAIERLKCALDYVKINYAFGNSNNIYKDTDILLNLTNKLVDRIKELEEINEEHQKLNGELQEKLTRAEGIIEGKCIQEMGMSDLYKED